MNRVVIAGSRNITDYYYVKKCIEHSGFDIDEVVCGGAEGVDSLGEKWAKQYGIAIKYFYPDWKNLGKVAAIIRNQEMALYANKLIAIWDGESKGTKHMIVYMRDKMMKPTKVYDPSL